MAIGKDSQTPKTTLKFAVKKEQSHRFSQTVKIKTIIPAEFQLVFHVLMAFIHASIYWIIIGYGKTESALKMSTCTYNLHTIQ